MAEFGAHFTATADAGKPSIFDVLAAEDLVSTLRPALKHALQVLTQRFPARLGRLYLLGDEVFTFLQLILEHYYLRHYGASFSENFYGMKRVPDVNDESRVDGSHAADTASLPIKHHLKSLICLVFVPYLKTKCDAIYEQMKEDNRTNRRMQGLRGRLCRAFLACYPYCHAIWEGTMLLYQLGYMLGKTRIHSPLLKTAGVHLEYLTQDDWNLHNSASTGNLDFKNKTWWQRLSSVGNHSLWWTARVLASSLSVGMFFLRFLELWYTSDQHRASLSALPTPPPPQMEKAAGLPKLDSICPLCHKMRTNDTVVSVTGYVFCYPCIYTYLHDNQRCPITSYPANVSHLVKLYIPDGG